MRKLKIQKIMESTTAIVSILSKHGYYFETVFRDIPIDIVKEVENAENRVLFRPLYYSYLQSIDLAWACIKDDFGSEYSKSSTLPVVKHCLEKNFEILNS